MDIAFLQAETIPNSMGGSKMIIDIHAADEYATAESIIAISTKHGLDKVMLCMNPRNNRLLNAPPNIPFMKSPGSIYLLNRILGLAYKSFRDYGDGNRYVFELRNFVTNKALASNNDCHTEPLFKTRNTIGYR
jgi:hypothetical protein